MTSPARVEIDTRTLAGARRTATPCQATAPLLSGPVATVPAMTYTVIPFQYRASSNDKYPGAIYFPGELLPQDIAEISECCAGGGQERLLFVPQQVDVDPSGQPYYDETWWHELFLESAYTVDERPRFSPDFTVTKTSAESLLARFREVAESGWEPEI